MARPLPSVAPLLPAAARWLVALCLLGACHGRDEGVEDCHNGIDDDADGFPDCEDPACAEACVERCTNGFDDDGDGAADCLDPACSALCDEDCLDGIDDDGDLLADCADPGCASTCDGDGDGAPGPQVGGDDCDDADPTSYPGAAEIWYDGADNDCDPSTVDDDQDGDGFARGDDCDDVSAATFPGAPETCGDGAINDCDGGTPASSACYGERSLATADLVIDGTEADEGAGGAVAGSPDTNGDDSTDVLVGAQGHDSGGVADRGAAYLFSAPLAKSTPVSSSSCAMEGIGELDWAGSTLAAVGDMDGDGLPNFAVGARYQDQPGYRAGAVYLMVGVCVPGVLGSSALEITAGADFWELGTSVAAAGDVTGDGFPDLAVGAPQWTKLTDAGAVLLFEGPILAPRNSDDAWAGLYGVERNALAGYAVGTPGDTDGDGRDDLAVGAPLSDLGGADSGRVFVLNDLHGGAVTLPDTLFFSLGDAGDQLGSMIVSYSGDLTGDGLADLAIGAPYGGQDGAGKVWIVDGLFPSVTVAAELEGRAAADTFGVAGAALPDVDGDGRRDLVIGAPRDDAAGEDSGAAYVFFGPFAGARGVADADVSLYGEAAFDFAGSAVAPAGDLDGDLAVDLLVGAPFHDGLAPGSGRTYAVTFGF